MKYFLLILFMIPGISIVASPRSDTVKVEAGVVDKTLSVDGELVNEPATDPLIPAELLAPTTDQLQPICDEKCQKSESKQIDPFLLGKDKVDVPVVNDIAIPPAEKQPIINEDCTPKIKK